MPVRRAGRVNMKGIGRAISRLPQFQKAARRIAQRRVDQAKTQMIQAFSEHNVTQEIEGGVNADNISNTLGGIGSGGNLFTYIGFEEYQNPTLQVKMFLNRSIYIQGVIPAASKGGRATVHCKVTYPEVQQLRKISSLPWEPGKSWVEGIETGINGFGYYMYKKFQAGRSGLGLQTDKKVRQGHFRAVPYYSSILQNFRRRLAMYR